MTLRETTLRIYTDGGSRGNPGPAGCGAVVMDAETGEVLKELHEYIGETTNNQAEYRAVILGLRESVDLRPTKIMVIADSELLVRQLTGEYKVKNQELAKRYMEIHNLTVRLGCPIHYRHVRREQNKAADALANKAMDEGTKKKSGS